MKSGLSSLSADLLDLILHDPSLGHALVLIWRCGNRALNSKLASSLTRAHLSSDAVLTFACPRLVFSLRSLRSLCLSSPRSLMKKAKHWQRSLKCLPVTLEELRISSADANHAFFNYAPRAKPQAPRPGDFVETVFELGKSRFWDVGSAFPRLQTLQMEVPSLTKGSFSPEDLTALPSGLTHLISNSIYLNAESPCLMRYLPRGLLNLDAPLNITFAEQTPLMLEDWALAPPNLQDILSITTNKDVVDHLEWIPRTLEHLRINLSPSAPILNTLPPRLSTLLFGLSASNAPSSRANDPLTWDIPALATLEKARFNNAAFDVTKGVPVRSLTWLEVHGRPGINFMALRKATNQMKESKALFNFWPPNLSVLKFGATSISVLEVDLLPRTIHTLEVHIRSETPLVRTPQGFTLDASLLPPNLTVLEMMWVNNPLLIKNQLPASLTTAKLRLIQLGMNRSVPYPVGVIFENLPLPTSLTNYRCSPRLGSDVYDQHMLNMDSLTHLYLDQWRYKEIELLPPNVTHLSILALQNMDYATSASKRTFDEFSNFPRGITYLELGPGDAPTDLQQTFSVHALSSLTCLKELHALSLGTFPSQVVRNLPRNMSVLLLKVNILIEDAPFIPQNLKRLSIGSRASHAITPEMVAYWPLRAIADAPAQLTAGLEKRLRDLGVSLI